MLVVGVGVEGEGSDVLTCGFVDDANVEVGDEKDEGASGIGSADADVVEPAVVAEGEFSELIDSVGPDAVGCVGFNFVSGGFVGVGTRLGIGLIWSDSRPPDRPGNAHEVGLGRAGRTRRMHRSGGGCRQLGNVRSLFRKRTPE